MLLFSKHFFVLNWKGRNRIVFSTFKGRFYRFVGCKKYLNSQAACLTLGMNLYHYFYY